MTSLHFHVQAEAAPQGSKRGMVHRSTGRVVLLEVSKRVKPYRDSVRAAALEHTTGTLTGPVLVELGFWFHRPKAHYGTGRNRTTLRPGAPTMHTQRPDVDKLIRSTLDALTGTVWHDDSQVIAVSGGKQWTSQPSFVAVTVRTLDDLDDLEAEA